MKRKEDYDHFVRDGARTLHFDGVKLAHSSSRVADRPRWVEFELYKTPRGQYVLARIGKSVYYHDYSCGAVSRNRLGAVDESALSMESIPCPKCRPQRVSIEGVYPETPRYWAQYSETAKGVVASLMKYDDNDTEYLTNVARRLLEDAAKTDFEIANAYYVDILE